MLSCEEFSLWSLSSRDFLLKLDMRGMAINKEVLLCGDLWLKTVRIM